MRRTPITANEFIDAGYDEPNNILQLGLKDKSVKLIFQVPPQVYTEFLQTSDKDKYFEDNIKYKFRSTFSVFPPQ